MWRIGEKLDIDFVVSIGDNFYDNGLEKMTQHLKNHFSKSTQQRACKSNGIAASSLITHLLPQHQFHI